MNATRREFVKLLGGGIVVIMTSKPTDLFGQRRISYPEDPNAYLRIDENGAVTLFSGKIEMGQGVHTSLAQMAAEELGVPLDSITVVMGDTDLVPYDQGTWGSLTTRFFGPAVRAAAAEARTVMLNLGAQKLGTTKDKVTVENGHVSDGKRRVSYGELAKGKQISRLVDEKAVLRSAKDYKIVGKPTKRLDRFEKVSGKAKYAGDIKHPGMLYARLVRPPMHGAKMKSADTSKAKTMNGVTVVEQGDLIAVLHADPEVAAAALKTVTSDWDRADAPFDTESVHDYFAKNVAAPEAKGQFESTFKTGYLAHAPMETHTASAEWKDGRLTAWVGTQSPFGVRANIAKALNIDEKQVRVMTPYVGGGFGGKSPAPQAIEAAKLAQITGKPVMVHFTRSEEFYFDTYGPASVINVVSSVDANGKITQWEYTTRGSGGRATDILYDVPGAKVSSQRVTLHQFGTGPWRAPGAGHNVFAKESQIDIMAAGSKIDPLDFRLRNLTDKRALSVLKAAADAFGWKAGAGPSGQGRAIAFAEDAGSYTALAAEIALDKQTGEIKVKRVVAAQDMGQVINPEGAKMQMEGCIAMGLGYVLSEELNFKGGEILDKNFDTYNLPRFSMVPKIETIIVANDDLSPQGGGEPAIVPMGAVIANALFDLTGVRMYRLPMTPERVKAALKS